MPHFNFTATGFPVRSARNGFGLTIYIPHRPSASIDPIPARPAVRTCGADIVTKIRRYGLPNNNTITPCHACSLRDGTCTKRATVQYTLRK